MGVFLFCVDLKPDGATFAEPVTVRAPNLVDLSEGAPVPITWYDESVASWVRTGMGTVTPDGEHIEFAVNHFSVYHGNWHHTDEDETSGDSADISDDGSECPRHECGSGVPYKTGELKLDYTVPGGPAMSNIDVQLVYSSDAASARKQLTIGAPSARLVPPYFEFSVQRPDGFARWLFHGASYPYRLAYVWDAANLETGLYPYSYRFAEFFPPGRYRYATDIAENKYVDYMAPTLKTNQYYGFKTVVNRRNSPYGAGWAIQGVTHIVSRKGDLPSKLPCAYRDPDTGERRFFGSDRPVPDSMPVLTTLGATLGVLRAEHVAIVGSGTEGTIYWYDEASGVYLPPQGSDDMLVRSSEGWVHRMGDGSREEYSEDGLLLKRIDPRGRATLYEYDSFGERVQRIIDETTGACAQLLYDERDMLSTVVDQFGRKTSFTVDSEGDLVEIVSPDDRIARRFEYDSHRAVRKELPGGAASEYVYDEYGSIVRTVAPSGLETTFYRSTDGGMLNAIPRMQSSDVRWVDMGATICKDAGAGQFCRTFHNWVPVYEPSARRILPRASTEYSISDQLGDSTAYVFDSYGRIVRKTDAAGQTVRYEYESGGCCGEVTRIQYPNGLVISRSMDERGNLLSTHNSATDATTEYAYITIDSVDYIESITNALGQQTRFGYDSAGNLVRLIAPGGDTTAIAYDETALPVAVTDPLGRTVGTAYDSLGRVVARMTPMGDTTTYTYDRYGNLAAVTDPTGRVSRYEYDIVGRLLREINPAGDTVRYSYDEAGRLDSLIDPLHHHTTFDYDTAGNLVRSTNHLGISRTYEYDEQSKLTAYTNARGQTINYQYDILKRLVRKVTDDSLVLSRFGYDVMGNMTYAATPGYTMNRSFDPAGRMVQEIVSGFSVEDTLAAGDTIRADDFSRDYTHLVVNGGEVV
ncbi:MAG: hypothetical protein GF331_02895, partial [Chitinivibrionales bacterium]|nr:hypothetical protein [Chitinivibrionales bacterium]